VVVERGGGETAGATRERVRFVRRIAMQDALYTRRRRDPATVLTTCAHQKGRSGQPS
jgi:hypothetical protein